MKIYKYRDFSNPTEKDFRRLEDLVHRHLVWCARPDALNDPQEFVWECDYAPTAATVDFLTDLLVKARGRTRAEAHARAEEVIQNGRLESVARPVFVGMIEQCRSEIGLSCFGTAPDNEVLWAGYAARGAGVCVEFEVPDDLLGTQLHLVQYLDDKRLHVDQVLQAFVDRRHVPTVYNRVLLSKSSAWAEEKEIRFVSQQHSIQVALDRAQVPCLILGNELRAEVRARIERLAAATPIAHHPPFIHPKPDSSGV